MRLSRAAWQAGHRGTLAPVFSRPAAGYPEGIQLAIEPFTRHSPFIGGKGPWTVTVPIDRTLGQPARCMVAAQPTMDFQGAP
jgi:hypothetical protein